MVLKKLVLKDNYMDRYGNIIPYTTPSADIETRMNAKILPQ